MLLAIAATAALHRTNAPARPAPPAGVAAAAALPPRPTMTPATRRPSVSLAPRLLGEDGGVGILGVDLPAAP